MLKRREFQGKRKPTLEDRSMSIANRLKKLRSDRKLMIREVSKALGVPASTYRDWEYGNAIRDIEAYGRIADFYGVSLDELILGRSKQDHGALEHLLEAKENIERAIKSVKTL